MLEKQVFDVFEIFLDNDPSQEIKSLIGAGFIEAMQNDVYSWKPDPDYFSQFMGKRFLKMWGDIIEGFSGQGIRTVADWRKNS